MYSLTTAAHALTDPLFDEEVCSNWQALGEHLRCPVCLHPLESVHQGLFCADCRRVWPVLGGMPWLAQSDQHYHADVPETAMRQLVADSLQVGWRKAFRTMVAGLPAVKAEVITRNVLDSARSLGMSLLPVQADTHVLDIGCGWGTLTLPLAESAGLVVGLDLAPLRARFTQIRAQQEGYSNLVVMGGGDTRHLPFDDGFFDIVVLNGVLEWTATSRNGCPRDAYKEFLGEVHRLLKPGGAVYIGIENRLSYLYFLGLPEDHIELPYIALLPRRLADRYALWQRGIAYRTHTYSWFGYRRLLAESGFGDSQAFFPHPNYRMPIKIIPLSDLAALFHMLPFFEFKGSVRKFTASLLARTGLLGLLSHSFIIVARKQDGSLD